MTSFFEIVILRNFVRNLRSIQRQGEKLIAGEGIAQSSVILLLYHHKTGLLLLVQRITNLLCISLVAVWHELQTVESAFILQFYHLNITRLPANQ